MQSRYYEVLINISNDILLRGVFQKKLISITAKVCKLLRTSQAISWLFKCIKVYNDQQEIFLTILYEVRCFRMLWRS